MGVRARLLSWAVERKVKRPMGSSLDVPRMRSVAERFAMTPAGVEFSAITIAGVPGERAVAKGAVGRRLLYLHGGGFVACSARTHRPITGAFARRGFEVIAPNYRLAPENRFPAALDDLVAVWSVLSAEGPLAVAGDSAGGNLALALMLRARDEGLPQPAAAVLFSPATDLLGTGASHVENGARDVMLDQDLLRQLVPAYLGDADPGQPLASPLFADLAGLPPMLLHVGRQEALRDDSTRLVGKARAAGVDAHVVVFADVPHVWQWAELFLPEARRSLDAAAAFLGKRLAPEHGARPSV